jgi:2-polyprenyl-3-methyl-5-hydroxy-6-metoxy-1,4-benzoquinol methylase
MLMNWPTIYEESSRNLAVLHQDKLLSPAEAAAEQHPDKGGQVNSASMIPIMEAIMAYQKTAALIAAVKLDLFTLIGPGITTYEDLSRKAQAAPRGVRILCDSLCVMGLLQKQEAGYSLTPASRLFLDNSSPAAMGSIIDYLAAPVMIKLFLDDPVSYVRGGGSVGLATVAPDHPIWPRFAKSMVPIASRTAKRVASYIATLSNRPYTVLDIAAGHGLYGIEVAKAFPEAFVTALDWTEVLAIARANAEKAGVQRRYRTLPGNLFEVDWGKDFDIILLSNIIHHFDEEGCITLLRKAKASLARGGRTLVIDFMPNPDRVSPPIQAMFALFVLATTPSGNAYIVSEVEQMAKAAGFRSATARALLPTPHTLVALEH